MLVQLKIIKRIKTASKWLEKQTDSKTRNTRKVIFIYILFFKKWNLEHILFIFIPSLIKIKVQLTSIESGPTFV